MATEREITDDMRVSDSTIREIEKEAFRRGYHAASFIRVSMLKSDPRIGGRDSKLQ